MEYKQKIYKFLQDAETGKTFTIDRICVTENQPRFIEIVKQYMNETPWQGGWEFNTDYTKLKRIDLNFETNTQTQKLKQYQ